jgi:hypothetical protein
MYGCIICEHPKRYSTFNYDMFLGIQKNKLGCSYLPILSLINEYLPINMDMKMHLLHGYCIYITKSLNCVYVFYVRIEITIEYDHEIWNNNSMRN